MVAEEAQEVEVGDSISTLLAKSKKFVRLRLSWMQKAAFLTAGRHRPWHQQPHQIFAETCR